MAIERVTETVSIGQRPGFVKTSVYSQVQYEGYSRHKEEVTFRPQLSPVKHSDTIYVYINNTRKRYVSRTHYETRVKPKTFAETTYTCPKTARQVFVSYVDQNPPADDRKRFKTVVEIRPRRFRSSQTITSPTDVNSNSLSAVDQTLMDQQQQLINDGNNNNNRNHILNGVRDPNDSLSDINTENQPFEEIYDPGASQVFIPKRRNFASSSSDSAPFQQNAGQLLNGQLLLDFPNGDVDLRFRQNGDLNYDDDYSDV